MSEPTPTQPEPGWQPIETAPENREVLVWYMGDSYTAMLINGEWKGTAGGVPYYEDDGSSGEYDLTHARMGPSLWRPKPEDPEQPDA
jgi:hypothetical protein